MSAAAQLRAELTAAVAEHHPAAVVDHVPEAITPPLFLLTQDDPYLTPTDLVVGGELVAHLVLVAIADTADNAGALDALEGMAEAVATALPDEFDQAGAPFQLDVAGDLFLACQINLSTAYTLTPPEGALPL